MAFLWETKRKLFKNRNSALIICLFQPNEARQSNERYQSKFYFAWNHHWVMNGFRSHRNKHSIHQNVLIINLIDGAIWDYESLPLRRLTWRWFDSRRGVDWGRFFLFDFNVKLFETVQDVDLARFKLNFSPKNFLHFTLKTINLT